MRRWLMAVPVALALGLAIAESSEAWHLGYRHYDYPRGYPYAYPYPYMYPPPLVVQPPPPVYIQPPPPPQSSWYWCRQPEGYYPYVQQCPGGWLQVFPQTPPAPAPR